MKAIEKLPADRFQTAEVLAEQLEELALARTGRHGPELVVRALEHAGLVTPSEAEAGAPPLVRARGSLRRTVAGLGVLGALAVGGGIALQATGVREGQATGSRPLELVPANPGFLRVLATPWAEVWVDGQRADVTPFARPIPLRPGTHYVTLTHPSAPAQKRTLVVASGETATIDVVMDLHAPEPPSAEGGVSAPGDAGPPQASAQTEAR
jgi:serine/threonine-protein kinase